MPCLDGLRSIAALSVLANHLRFYDDRIIINREYQPPGADILQHLFTLGRINVDTFFVLGATLAALKMLQDLSKLVLIHFACEFF